MFIASLISLACYLINKAPPAWVERATTRFEVCYSVH